ncbi:transposase (plasmid) [Azospirillum sp. B510]|nr:transposase [Azospirillum sp. B510]
MEGFKACFGALDDPRRGNARQHDLHEMLMIALCTFLCGGRTCIDMAEFADERQEFLGEFLTLKGGPPAYFGEFAQAFRLKAPTVSAKAPTRIASWWEPGPNPGFTL